MTQDTIDFLTWVLAQQTIQVGAPDARLIAQRAFAAQDELAALTPAA